MSATALEKVVYATEKALRERIAADIRSQKRAGDYYKNAALERAAHIAEGKQQ